MHTHYIRLPLLALGLAALACGSLGSPALTPTAPATLAAAGQTPASGTTPVAGVTTSPVGATPSGSTPEGVNLSGSGTAATARLAFDASGTLHLVWFDTSARATGDFFHRQKAANGD